MPDIYNLRYTPTRRIATGAQTTRLLAGVVFALAVFVCGFSAACAPLLAPTIQAMVAPARDAVTNYVNAEAYEGHAALARVWGRF